MVRIVVIVAAMVCALLVSVYVHLEGVKFDVTVVTSRGTSQTSGSSRPNSSGEAQPQADLHYLAPMITFDPLGAREGDNLSDRVDKSLVPALGGGANWQEPSTAPSRKSEDLSRPSARSRSGRFWFAAASTGR